MTGHSRVYFLTVRPARTREPPQVGSYHDGIDLPAPPDAPMLHRHRVRNEADGMGSVVAACVFANSTSLRFVHRDGVEAEGSVFLDEVEDVR